jgi:hypothetical protein
MMMKTMKLMMATALATATLVGTSRESAEAVSRSSGNEATGSRTNNVDVNYRFKLYGITPTGNPRKDEDDIPNNNIGIFNGAIEDFTATITDTLEVEGLSEFGVYPEFKVAKIKTPSILNLKAVLIPESRIEYILSGETLANEGITELSLIIDNFVDEDDPTQVDNFESIVDPIQAVNSLEYIINNQLLEKIDKIRVRSNTASSEGGVGPSVKAERTDDRIVEVPESSTTNSLLALGFLGVGSLLRRKMKEPNRIQL